MKRFLVLGLILTLIIGSTIGLYPVSVAAADDYQFTAGDGSPGNPYVVMTAEDLDHVRDKLAASYILGADIDLSSYSTGAGWEPIGEDASSPFTGTFDGNDYLIRNLFIDRDVAYGGLFGFSQNATLQYIRLLDVDITGSIQFLGSLVGMANRTEIIGSSVSAFSASGIDNNMDFATDSGGLVGYLVGNGAAIKNSYAAIDVSAVRGAGGLLGFSEPTADGIESSFASGSVTTSNIYAGGLVNSLRTNLHNSYSIGNVMGTNYIGGLAGETVLNFIGYTIDSSFQTGTVTATGEAGKFIGNYFGPNLVTDLIYNSSVNVTLPEIGNYENPVTGTTGLSDEDMKTKVAYGTTLDFDTVWGINEGISYPYLRVFTPIVRINDSLQASYKEDSQLVLDGFVMDGSIGEAVEVNYTIRNSSNMPVANGSEVLVSATEDIQMYSFSETLDATRFPEGTYTIQVVAEDLEGHQARQQTTTFIVDHTAPVITLIGANPLQHEVGTTFNDPGATALDTVDGDVTSDITVSGSVDSNTVGSYTLTYSVTDAAGNVGTVMRTVEVVDTVAPVITLVGANPLQHEVGTAFSDPGATALDAVDGDITSDITVSGSVDSSTVGIYTLTYTVADAAGNVAAPVTRTVEVVDTVAPVITLVGATLLQHEVGTTFSDPGATALDAVDGDITSDITVSGSVDSNTVGNYTLIYSVTDAAGNEGTQTRIVIVVDTVAPVITLIGANPLQHEAGTIYADPGATALDEIDGDLTDDITVSGSVDSNTVGNYTLTYSVTDASGNEATRTRTVNVVDTVAPVITLNGANPLQHEVGTTYIDLGATAQDVVDGDVTSEITVSGSVDSNTVGNYMLIYSVTDAAGNEATITRNVNVIDTVAPVITLTGANPLQHEVGTIYTDPGATALDAGDGDVSGDIIVDGSVDSSRVGSYTLTYSVTDAAGNEATMTRNVDVIDTVAPVITLTGANSLQHEVGTTFTEPGATALDAGDGDVTSDITVSGSVDSSRVGNYTLTYSVTDAAGNVATETRTVNVVDTVAPVITLIGSNPYSLTLGSLFHDPGATALDAGDGDVTSSITVSGTVDRNRVGNYSLTYEVADGAGNIATATRTIRITRAYEVASNDSRLAQLTAEVAGVAKQLTPSFHSEVTEYRLETTGDQIELTLRPADVNAVITVQQQVVEDKIVLPLVEGTQTITVTVHAENGSLRNYLLHITNVVEVDHETPVEEACLFMDIQGHWAEKAICQAASLKIVEGLSQSIFAPNQSVTRAEFAVMLLRTLQVPIGQQEVHQAFSDAATIPQWAQDIIMTGVDKGILDGYPDGTFRPQQVINRAEMAAMLAKAMDWNKEQAVELPFADATSIPTWSLPYVEAVYSEGLLQGRSGNQFSPDGVTTRAEAAVVMLRLWQLLNQQEK